MTFIFNTSWSKFYLCVLSEKHLRLVTSKPPRRTDLTLKERRGRASCRVSPRSAVFSVLIASLFILPVKCDVIYNYPGPSEWSVHHLRIRGFSISGPSDLQVGNSITVKFTLENWAQAPISFTDLGVFVAARDPNQRDASFGFNFKNLKLDPGKNVTLSASRTLGVAGVWKIWPSYQVYWVNGKEFGPSEWHAAYLLVSTVKLPDLVVIKVLSDRENSRIGYVVKNEGTATAKAGYRMALYVDSEKVAEDVVSYDLNPGETKESWFEDYAWPMCKTIQVIAEVDFLNQVAELNEDNNHLRTTVESFRVPLQIISGPNLTMVTHDSAVITWITNGEGDTLCWWSCSSSVLDLSHDEALLAFIDTVNGTVKDSCFYNSSFTRLHVATIGELKSGSVYWACVSSRDVCGSTSGTMKVFFETLPPTDKRKPDVSIVMPDALSGVVNITAVAFDDIGVSRVVFYIDDTLKRTDYSPPYTWLCDTSAFLNGVRKFSVIALDSAGNEAADVKTGIINNRTPDGTPPSVMITYPGIGDSVHGIVRISSIVQDHEGYVDQVKAYVDGVYVRGWAYSPLELNPLTRELTRVPPINNISFLFLWNTTGLEQGSEHTITIEALDDSGNLGRTSINAFISKFEYVTPSLSPMILDLEITREVVRRANYFEVILHLRNTGTVTISDVEVIDQCPGFQALPTGDVKRISYTLDLSGSVVTCKYRGNHGILYSGDFADLRYYVIPILFNDIVKRELGFGGTVVRFSAGGVPHGRRIYIPHALTPTEINEALRSADYLIVTSPSRLFTLNPSDAEGVDILLAKVGELASLKLGVLGYLPEPSTPSLLKDLISPGGYWAIRLSEAFAQPDRRDAYLLIVGETEVVPAYNYSDVHLSDHYYADVVGDGAPDLIVGRIIGDTARNLTMPIQASIDVALGFGFDRENALVVAGCEDDLTDTVPLIPFADLAFEAIRDLTGRGTTAALVDWNDFVQRVWPVYFTNNDAFVLGDIDGNGIDEAIIANDEEGVIRIYDLSDGRLLRIFGCRFTRHDGLATGDLDGDGMDEIITAVDDDGVDGMVYVYEPDGTVITSLGCRFTNWDSISTGDVWGDNKDEVLIASDDLDEVRIYGLHETNLRLVNSWYADFDQYDAFDVGELVTTWAGTSWPKREVAICKESDHLVYVYGADGTLIDRKDIGFCRYDAFSVGDVGAVVLSRSGTISLCSPSRFKRSIYSRFVSAWFDGVRYTGDTGSSGRDCADLGNPIAGEGQRLVVIRNENGVSLLSIIVPEYGGACDLAVNRFDLYAGGASILVFLGHGNDRGVHPIWASHVVGMNFRRHPLVIAISCIAGDYEGLFSYPEYTFADAILGRGAAVFIGSTEESYSSRNEAIAKNYFEQWDYWNVRAGVFFTQNERAKYRSGGKWIFWVKEYNYYGDPKFPTGG